MKKNIILSVILFSISLVQSFAQLKPITIKITPLQKGKTLVHWNSDEKSLQQISLQRSTDSTGFFTTVYSPVNVTLKEYSFIDFYPVSTHEVFYRILFVNKIGDIFFSNVFPRSTEVSAKQSLKRIDFSVQNQTKIAKVSVNKNYADTSKNISIETSKEIKPKNNELKNKQEEIVFSGVKSNMPDTYTIKSSNNKKKTEEESVDKEFNSKNKKQRKQVMDDLVAKNKSTNANVSTAKNKIKSLQKNVDSTEKNLNKEVVVKQTSGRKAALAISNQKEIKSSQKNLDSTKKNVDEELVIKSTPRKKIASSNNNSPQQEPTENNKNIDTTQANKASKNTSTSGIYGAPGKLIGKVINAKTGEVLSNATVKITGGSTNKSAKTDYNGNFIFNNIPSGLYTITCVYIGYTTNVLDEVKIIRDEVTTQDITMNESKGKNLDDIIVKSSSSGSRKNAETVNALLVLQKNAASVSDGISAETIKRTPDRNTSDILKRVSGASIQDDKFAIIRGLNDRYNAVFLNSSPLPSTESDRKAFSFDIFPANMLDNLTIVKTATPDMPGEFAGGLIFINTKDIPSKDFQSVTFGLGYNTQATFKERKYYKGGRFDFLGLDDGTRALSANIPAAGQLVSNNVNIDAQKNYAKYIPNNWKTLIGVAPLNVNLQYVRGINIQKKQNDFIGILIAATYSRSYNYTYGERDSYDYDRSSASQPPQQKANFLDKNYASQVLAGLMANVSLKINNNNRLSWKNIISINSDDKMITRDGTPDYTNEPDRISMSSVKWFTSNVIASTQLLGEHFISKPKLKLNWMGSYTSVNRQIPNLRRLASYIDPIDGKIKQDVPDFTISPDNGGTMFFASTKENLKSFKLDLERKFSFNNKFSIQVKAGSLIQSRHRDFTARYLGLRKYQSGNVQFDKSLLELDEASVFDSKNFGKLKNNKGGFLLTEDYRKNNTYDAGSGLLANYIMLDSRLFKFIRVNGGLRVESFTQKLNSFDDNNKPVTLDSTVTDYLPSANLIISLNSKQNLRFGYSKTLNRPEYRELAPFIFYDYTTRLSIYGNPNITRATVDNYDIRYEFYPGKGQLLSVSGFYKKIINPIELVLDPNIDNTARYQNTPEATIKGFEFETRIQLSSLLKSKNSLWENLTVFGNVAFIKSEINLGADTVLYGPNRSLQGQSPYLFNAGIIYQHPNGFSATAQINKVGQRIFVAGNSADMHIWENGRPVVDLQIAKMFEKQGLEFKLNIKDLLAKQLVYFFDVNDDGKYNKDNKQNLNAETDKIFSVINYGRTISASVTYKF